MSMTMEQDVTQLQQEYSRSEVKLPQNLDSLMQCEGSTISRQPKFGKTLRTTMCGMCDNRSEDIQWLGLGWGHCAGCALSGPKRRATVGSRIRLAKRVSHPTVSARWPQQALKSAENWVFSHSRRKSLKHFVVVHCWPSSMYNPMVSSSSCQTRT